MRIIESASGGVRNAASVAATSNAQRRLRRRNVGFTIPSEVSSTITSGSSVMMPNARMIWAANPK